MIYRRYSLLSLRVLELKWRTPTGPLWCSQWHSYTLYTTHTSTPFSWTQGFNFFFSLFFWHLDVRTYIYTKSVCQISGTHPCLAPDYFFLDPFPLAISTSVFENQWITFHWMHTICIYIYICVYMYSVWSVLCARWFREQAFASAVRVAQPSADPSFTATQAAGQSLMKRCDTIWFVQLNSDISSGHSLNRLTFHSQLMPQYLWKEPHCHVTKCSTFWCLWWICFRRKMRSSSAWWNYK